jgi:hypothetical protein
LYAYVFEAELRALRILKYHSLVAALGRAPVILKTTPVQQKCPDPQPFGREQPRALASGTCHVLRVRLDHHMLAMVTGHGSGCKLLMQQE